VVSITDDDPALLLSVRPHTAVYRSRSVVHAYIPVDVIGGETGLPSTVHYTVGAACHTLRAISSTCILCPGFSNGMASYEVTSNIWQALRVGGGSLAPSMFTAKSGVLTWAPHDQGTKFVKVQLNWDEIPYEGELALGMTLSVILNARLEDDHDKMAAAFSALHVYGVPLGACPPGTRRSTDVGWVANLPPPPPPLPTSPPPPQPPPPTGDGDAEMESIIVYVQPRAVKDPVTGATSIPAEVTIPLSPSFLPGTYRYESDLLYDYSEVKIQYR